MDLITWPYRSQMAIYQDRPDYLVWGKWRFCQPGAECVPFLHPWTSSFLHPDDPLPDGWPEEKRRWLRDGLNADPDTSPSPGLSRCGGERDWQVSLWSERGTLAVDAVGVPFCCGGNVVGEGEVDGDASEQETAFHGSEQDGEVDGDESGGTGFLGGLALGTPLEEESEGG